MRTRVIMVEPEHEGNVGSVARAMKNFGFSELCLVKPRVRLGAEAYAYAAHSKRLLDSAVVLESLEDAIRGIDLVVGTTSVVARRPANLRRIPLSPQQLGEHLKGFAMSVGLLLGRESKGLSNKELALCDIIVTIPCSEAHPVLNVAMAATVVFYEIFKHVQEAPPTCMPMANRVVRLRLVETFRHVAVLTGIPTQKREKAVQAFRNIASRSFMTGREASLIIGVLRRGRNRLSNVSA